MLPQLEFMYAPTIIRSKRSSRPNLGATATVCSDLKDNLIGGTLEPLASLRRLRLLCDPSMASPCDVPPLLERPSLRRYTVSRLHVCSAVSRNRIRGGLSPLANLTMLETMYRAQ
jgi:hypothetical protein